jgi:hypothetical protein
MESIDALYKKAKAEGRVVIYAAASTRTEEMLFGDDTKDYPKYEKLWNELFQIR